jgi:hypothetical protein
VQWARLHVANGKLISKHRCIALAADGHGRFRLWQLVRNEHSLRTRIETALTKDASAITDALLSSARTFLNMAARLAATTCELPLTLDTIGSSTLGPIYVGRLATPSTALPARSWSAAQATDALISELGFAQPTLRAHRSHVFAELARLARDPDSYTPTEWRVLQRLVALTGE